MQIHPLGTNPSTVIQHSSAVIPARPVIPAPSLSFPHPSAVIPAPSLSFPHPPCHSRTLPLSFPQYLSGNPYWIMPPRCHSRSLLSGNPYWIMLALIRLTQTGFPLKSLPLQAVSRGLRE